MFRSSTIIRELALNTAKVIFTFKYSVKLRHGMACVLLTTHTPFHNMLPHKYIINNNIISPKILI
jgi:hypothetical protein